MVMGCFSASRFVRVHADPQVAERNNDRRLQVPNQQGSKHRISGKLKAKVLRRVFPEDFERAKNNILDPRGQTIRQWNKIFLAACLVSLFIDPLFFYLPIVSGEVCIDIATGLKITITIIRSAADIFYAIQILVRFHTAYVAPSSRVFGRGELVIDPSKIAQRYLKNGFWLDLYAALPLLQVLVWIITPSIDGWAVAGLHNFLWFSFMIQYLPRVYLVFQLSSQIFDGTGVITRTASAGAGYNLLLFMLAAHVSGACWYLLSIQRQNDCWRDVCKVENTYCPNRFFDCRNVEEPKRVDWFKSSNVTANCNPNTNNNSYPFGIYVYAPQLNIAGSAFINKYFYCLWWGLKNLSTLGQNLTTTIRVGENIFVTIIAILGLFLFALLIGNMQRILQSTTKRLEEWRIKRTDAEHWMHNRQLPYKLRQSVRKYDQYKWLTTKGVDEEALINSFPLDLRRRIKRHLCFDLLRQVPLFNDMDETTLDAICERLKPVLCCKDVFLLREGDPVNHMLFIVRGNLDSFTTNGGRTGFFNSSKIGPGDFCGEELLTWALDPQPVMILPSSTRTVKATSEVEAFSLTAEDLKFVASQFRKLHSKHVRHKFRFYSHQWRTWAACFIQAAWRRYKRLKEVTEMTGRESGAWQASGPFWTTYAESLVRGSGSMKQSGSDVFVLRSIEKPTDPDFSLDYK